MENYVLTKKTTSFVLLKLDAKDLVTQQINSIFGHSEQNLNQLGTDLDIESIKKIYQITDEETMLRNGLINGILNNIIIKKLR